MKEKIYYENKRYKYVSDISLKDKLDKIIELLSDIETEISNDKNGSIQLYSNGKIFVSNFESKLFEKISARLNRDK